MAAGQGFKTFTTGEVLTAADTNGYLMQGVLVFADATARDAAITSPQEGQFAYLKDTNVTTYYTGSAWANLDTTGMTNPMTTTGDTIYSSSGSTPARLGIGSTGQVLTVAGGVPSWATPASGGGMTLLSTTTASGSSTTVSSINQTYKDLVVITNGLSISGNPTVSIRLNNSANQNSAGSRNTVASGTALIGFSDYAYLNSGTDFGSSTNNSFAIYIRNYASASYYKPFYFQSVWTNSTSQLNSLSAGGGNTSNSAITSFVLFQNGGSTFSGGQILVYGVN